MADNNYEQRHLETLDRDLGRLSALGQATSYATRPVMGLGVSLAFIILAGLIALYLFGNTGNTVVVVIAAVLRCLLVLSCVECLRAGPP